jgi:dTDP-4-dehydrorhamnose 3,5-epimerase
MTVEDLTLPGVKLIRPDRHTDPRGFFSETYHRDDLAARGIRDDFMQDNHSASAKAGTVRGLHFQTPPFAQVKLVRVSRGAAYDVVVDIRRNSPSFGRHVFVELSAANGLQIYVPIGFAHGVCTLEPDTEVQYKVTAPYSKPNDCGLLWNDPALAIAWPVKSEDAVLSDADTRRPTLAELELCFDYRG